MIMKTFRTYRDGLRISGKIYGEIDLIDWFPGAPACGGNAMLFFNPVENDTNLECDSESFRNWLEAQKRGEPVGAGLFVL